MTAFAPQDEYVCSAELVSRTFGCTAVLRNLNFSFAAGERIVLLGANGSGKSTLLRILSGVSQPDSGSVRWQSGIQTGYLSQDLLAYSALTVRENLDFFSSLLPGQRRPDLDHWGLTARADRLVAELSKGLQQRVNLCRLFSEARPFLLLDEPTTYLDAGGVDCFRSALESFCAADGAHGFLLASHDITHLLGLASRVVLLSQGAIALDSGSSAVSIEEVLRAYREVNK